MTEIQRKKKLTNQRQTGACYERQAAEYLRELGYEILEQNYRCRLGEIDIVAKDGQYVVFCEVKYRKTEKRAVLWRQWTRESSM